MIALRWNIAQSFERLWWQNYLSGTDKHRYLSWKKNYWEDVLQQVFEWTGHEHAADFKNRSLQVLDAGCGPSGIFLNLPQHQVDALDPLMHQYLQEHQLIERQDYPNVGFMRGKLEDFSRKAAYDYVFCMNCINHVNDIGMCLENMFAALKDKGFLVITVDAHKYSIVNRVLSAIPADVLHPYQLSVDDYTHLLEDKFKTSAAKKLIKAGLLFDHYLIMVQKRFALS